MESKFIRRHQQVIPKNKCIAIHRIYFVLAILFGLVFSVAMPMFSEQDGQYHYVAASGIVNLPTNLSNYGEYSVGSGMKGQEVFYQNGTYFQQYYLQKVELIPQKDIPRLPKALQSIWNYDYLGHLIPALGVWIGYHIYPSLGVMVTVGRLLNMAVCTTFLFFIIKWVKKGKLIFACIMLSPVAINSFASLSYDGINFVWVSLLIALAINMIVSERDKWKAYIPGIIILSILSFIWLKTNYLVFFAMFPIIVLDKVFRENQEKINMSLKSSSKKELNLKKVITLIFSLVTIVGVAVFYYWAHGNGGTRYILSRLWASFGITYTTNQNIVSQSLLTQTNRGYNLVPFWVSGVWFTLMLGALLAEEKYVKSKTISFGAIGVFLTSILAVYLAFVSWGGTTSGQIFGVQGRYFTPLLPMLSLGVSNENFKLEVSSYKAVVIAMIIVVTFSNSLLVVDTLSGMHGFFA